MMKKFLATIGVFLLMVYGCSNSWAQEADAMAIVEEALKNEDSQAQNVPFDVQHYLDQQVNSTIFTPKIPTPSRMFAADSSMPESFFSSNNLAKKVGSFYHAFGEVIVVQGKVVDSFGVPVEGAIIDIWQTNASGKYHSLLEVDSEYVDPYFNMSGKAISDNLGNYHFITIMPGAVPGRAPHINMNIYHTQFGKIETEMYFANHPYNEGDVQYMSYDEGERQMLTAEVNYSDIMNNSSTKVCEFDITMVGTHKFKGF